MSVGEFVWCDLSTFRPRRARKLYARLFGWHYNTIRQQDGSPYHIASTRKGPRAAIFEMPEKFQKIGLPSFWMPYFEVADLDAVVQRAQACGGNVELGPTPFNETASIALIRDPLGAGFTVCQGTALWPISQQAGHGEPANVALYVSEPKAVLSFYNAIFGWHLSQPVPSVFDAHLGSGKQVASIHQVGDDIRGNHQFWAIHFAVRNLAGSRRTLKRHGGAVLGDYRDERGSLILAKDPDDCAFFMRAVTRP